MSDQQSPRPWYADHVDRYIETDGAEGHDWNGNPTLLLTTRGRRSGEQRTLRLTWHREVDLVVLSLWREGRCTGTFRLRVSEVPALVEALQAGLEGDLQPSSAEARKQ